MPTPKMKAEFHETGNLSEQVERELRHGLMAGRFQPGQKLSLPEIALELGTSVTPVREAVFKLVGVHALEFRRGYSVSVPVMTRERYLEIGEIRKALEGLAARTATPLMSAADIREMAGLFAQFKAAKESSDVRAALEFNLRFRFLIYERAGMPVLRQVIEDFWLQTGPLFNFLFPLLPRTHQYEREYAMVLRGLRARDPEMVVTGIRDAIHVGTERILPYIELTSRG